MSNILLLVNISISNGPYGSTMTESIAWVTIHTMMIVCTMIKVIHTIHAILMLQWYLLS